MLVRAPNPRTVDVWADENRVLPAGSAEPGRYRSWRTPYMIPIVRAFSVPGVKKIPFVMSSQMGKSLSMQNIIGARLDDDPAPIIYVAPTQSNIDSVVEPKIMEMFRGCESLWNKLAKGHKSTKHHKRVSGVSFRMAWAGSATELASDSAVLGLVDEVDRMEQDVKGEGSPVELTEARTSVYPDGRIGVTSTPTEGTVDTFTHPDTGLDHWSVADPKLILSTVWRLWQEGSRYEWAVPCPSCREYFIPRFSLLTWPEKATPEIAEAKAGLACPHCGEIHKDSSKAWMNAHGYMLAPGQRPDAIGEDDGPCIIHDFEQEKSELVEFGDYLHRPTSIHSFWVSGLMSFSPKKTYGFIASKFLRATLSGEFERLKGVLNTDLGELFRVHGEAPEWQRVMDCSLGYGSGEVPEGVNFLTAGVDVQKNRVVYTVRGWGEGLTSWKIEHGELWGETDKNDVWDSLGDLISKDYNGLSISKMAIDSGYRPDDVYSFCRLHRGVAIPTKGHDQMDKPYRASMVDVNVRGKTVKNGIQLWHVNSDVMKSWVHSRVEWPKDQKGAWFISSDTDEDYCKQIVAEQRVSKPSGKIVWVAVATDNHYLDAESLAYAAARILGTTAPRSRPKKDAVQDEKHGAQSNHGSGWMGRRRGSWMRR